MGATSTTKLAKGIAIDMKSALIFVAACAISMCAFAKGGTHAVHGHVTKKGTYVAPSHATNPNGTKTDNYSNKGNVNPYTGKSGTKE